ncbi:hypothetical protein [Nocardia sp. NPDC050710]|uniref:hypothetical protein n=1 Tax=Nocardia sp. NPDC050710 TaxID=3157220 RepID=UPI0033C54494
MISTAPPRSATPPAHRRVAAATLVGTTLEWYDFMLYGTASARRGRGVGRGIAVPSRAAVATPLTDGWNRSRPAIEPLGLALDQLRRK